MNTVEVEIELTDEEWYTLMKIAHKQDITLNQLITNILREKLSELDEQEPTEPLTGW